MKFDYTDGNEARYMVSVYGWNIEDQYYVHTMFEARKLFKGLTEAHKDSNVAISIYNLSTDTRKEFIRLP